MTQNSSPPSDTTVNGTLLTLPVDVRKLDLNACMFSDSNHNKTFIVSGGSRIFQGGGGNDRAAGNKI